MTDRSAMLRARNRRIFAWSMTAAAIVHVFIIAFVSWKSAEAEARAPEIAAPGSAQWTGAPVDIFFGPPRIFRADQTLSDEPPGRVLEAARSIHTPTECALRVDRVTRTPGSAVVRLGVNSSGRIESVRLVDATGNRCWDAVVKQVVADLRYEWIPNEQFPAPVELLQPITVSWAFN